MKNKIILQFETLTPIHISTGNKLVFGIDYIVTEKENQFFRLNHKKILKKYSYFEIGKNQSVRAIQNYFFKFFGNKNLNLDDVSDFKISVSEMFLRKYNNLNLNGNLEVKEFPNQNGNFYIPASSVKGALLTILEKRSSSDNPAFSKIIMRDSFLKAGQMNVEILNRGKRNNQWIDVYAINLKVGESFEVEVLNDISNQILYLNEKSKNYYRKELEKAKKGLENFLKLNRFNVFENHFYQSLKKIETNLQNLKKDEFILNLGFGGTSYFKIFTDAQSPRSRNDSNQNVHTAFIDENKNHLGWCKVKIN